MATRNRVATTLASLGHIVALPARPPVIVVDNGSEDGTSDAVRATFSEVRVVTLPGNLGPTARNVGVELAATPFVAFSDDDSWWAPGALSRAADTLEAVPRLGLLAARILVGDDDVLDPACRDMADSPLPQQPDLPGPSLLGFVACGAVVRRAAFLEVGGFEALLSFYGEESLLAVDLVRMGWALAYVAEVVSHHHPSPVRDSRRRRELEVRNTVLSAWLRRPLVVALKRTGRALASAVTDPAARRGLAGALGRVPAALSRRRVVEHELERQLRLLEGSPGPSLRWRR